MSPSARLRFLERKLGKELSRKTSFCFYVWKGRKQTLLTIIHGADFHLDSPFAGLTPQRAAQRRGEQRELLSALAQLSRERRADLVLLSGDLLDSHQTYRETAQALAQTLGQIPCPVFLAPGNHDYYQVNSLYAALDWPKNVHIFTSGDLEAVELPQLGCVVHGRAFQAPREDASPLAGFSAPQDSKIHLMVLHGQVDGAGDYAPVSRADIAASGLAYLALGHVHQYSGIQREGTTFWAYPGCPEGRGFDETGEKGVLFVEVEPERVTSQFIPLCRRRYEIIRVDLTGVQDPAAAVRAALPEHAEAYILRILLTGEGSQPDLAALERTLAPPCYGLTLQDHTRLPRQLWERRDEDSLTGLFLQAMWEKCQSEPDNPLYQLCARYGLAALENREGEAL